MNAASEKQPANRSLRRSFFRIFAWGLIVLILYILSIGPVLKLTDDGNTSDVVMFLYTPLILLAQNCEPFGYFLFWYLFSLWGLHLG